jgi:hypothetical protein
VLCWFLTDDFFPSSSPHQERNLVCFLVKAVISGMSSASMSFETSQMCVLSLRLLFVIKLLQQLSLDVNFHFLLACQCTKLKEKIAEYTNSYSKF